MLGTVLIAIQRGMYENKQFLLLLFVWLLRHFCVCVCVSRWDVCGFL